MRTTLLPVVLLVILQDGNARRTCGGTYTAARGILQTPNFPGPFPLPLDCEWVIDVQNFAGNSNTSIVVYLTQLFVFEGLTFTEHMLYGTGYEVYRSGKQIHEVTEANISKIRWVQTFQNYLVIKLKLHSMDSVHLRVLDKFLDVYGFNITYEITTGPVRKNSCTMMDCGFTGVCYDHYTKFSCDCFEGYAGRHCSEGPESLCFHDGVPTCKNGGTCIHVGASAVKCVCLEGFAGSRCEEVTSIASQECDGCRAVCSFDGNLDKACQCGSSTTDFSNNPDGIGFATTLYLTNLPNLDKSRLKSFIKDQILRSLRMNHTRVEDIVVDSLIQGETSAEATIHFYCLKKEEKRIKVLLNRWVDQRAIGNLSVVSKEDKSRNELYLQSVSINQAGVIRENDEFILSCVARGSPTMKFRWFKDGLFINVTSSSRKWIKLIKNPHLANHYTALLGVQFADKLDEGLFTCQVEDSDVQHCVSHRVQVRSAPIVKIEPMTKTVRKGDNFTVKCYTLDEELATKYTYSWTKNKELLPVRTVTEKYEVLYPSGTILQIFNIEKDVQYSCLVHSSDGPSSEKRVNIYVVDRAGVYTCPAAPHKALLWPETAPDTDSVLDCPKGYLGVTRRGCLLRDGQRPVWNIPDYSDCTNFLLQNLQFKFNQLNLGYASSTVERLLQQIVQYVRQQSKILLPGEGVRILNLLDDLVVFVNRSKMGLDSVNVTNSLFEVLDRVLKSPDSLINQSHVRLLGEVVNKHLKDELSNLVSNHSTLHLEFETIDVSVINITKNASSGQFYLPFWTTKTNSWIGVQLDGESFTHSTEIISGADVLATVLFRNLSSFLPARSFLRLKDGSEVEYIIYSQIIQVWTLVQPFSTPLFTMNFHHHPGKTRNLSNFEQWSIKCASADLSTFVYTWDINSCQTIFVNGKQTQCLCPPDGIYTLLLTTVPLKVSEDQHDSRRYILVAGTSLCMMMALFTTACLATSCWLLRRSCLVVLKLQCSISIFIISLLFTVAAITGPQPKYFSSFLSVLEVFFLMGMSSHLSKLLIVFTELVQLPRPVTSKQTVIGIISGVPIITVFGNHLAYRTMDLRTDSWWMSVNTLAFYIFVTVCSILTILFVFIYGTVMKKLQVLKVSHEKNFKPIVKRVALLKRSGCLFGAITLLGISSILYINMSDVIWALYQFCACNILVGLILLVCYVIKAETEFNSMFSTKSLSNKDDKFFSMDSTSSPLNFLTRQESGSSSMKLDHKQYSFGPSMVHDVQKTQSLSSTFESCLHTSTSFCDGGTSSAATGNDQENLECYTTSPQQYRKNYLGYSACSPDILSPKVFVELDLVASAQQSSEAAAAKPPPKIVVTKPLVIQELRTQPDGHERAEASSAGIAEQQKPAGSSEDKLDGMLNRICHDLDYLLNDNELAAEPPPPPPPPQITTSTLRRISKPPSLGVIHQINEEDNVEVLRTDC